LLRRRPWLVAGCYLLPLLLYGLSLLWNLPTAVNPVAHLFALITISGTAAVVFPVLIGVRLIVGYRGAKDVDVRRRFRWIFASLLVGFALYLLFGQLSALVLGRPLVPYQWLLLAILPIPAALAAGILRYRLFDIEVILTRSLLVGAMTGIVAAGYAAVLLLTPRLDVLIGPPPPLVLLLLGGGIAAAAFAVRRQLARRVTTIVYGHRNNPYEVVERLSQLDTATAADQLFPDVVETLARALRLPYVRLELRGPDGNIETVAQYGAATGTPIGLPIQSNADVLGELELDVGAGREPFGPADRRLLDDITRHLAEACRTVLLARALQRSRERLVLAREEERRRLRRDLHDGIGPTLAALAMQMDLTGTMLERDLRGVERKLQDMGVTTRDLIGDIRRIVEDLRPPALDQLGLVGAIIENTQGFIRPDRPGGGAGFAVTVTTANDLGELPAGVEVAAFRIAVEAVTNAARYSGSRTCVVTLRRSVDLLLQVEDDGHGLQARIQGGGVGLVSMRERAAELGGDCVIENRSDRSGTVVRARLPLQGPVRSR
jgi:signal transduction histidine kinase